MLEKFLLMSLLLHQCAHVSTELIACSHDDTDQPPPIRMPSGSKKSKGPKFHFARHEEFVPYKVLFLIDETIPEPDFSKFKMATEYVNERLSKFLKAKRLMDLRLVIYKDLCSTCPRAKLPPEYLMPKCVSTDTPMKPNENASEKIIERSKENYTLIVRVLSNMDGIAAGQANVTCTGLASASKCNFAPHLGGPTHGVFTYCKKYRDFKRGDIQLNTTTLHETLHIVLPALTGQFEPSYGCGGDLEQCKGKTWKEVTRTITNEQGETKTVTSFLAITEPIRDTARAHFNCPHAEGLQLDYTRKNGKISPTAHWSMHLFPDEILAPLDAPSQKLSNLTMSALAAHSSWYKVDFRYAEELVISKPSAEMGCAVYEKTCHEFLNEQGEKNREMEHKLAPYCDMNEAGSERVPSKCSNDHKIQLRCRKDEKTNCTHMVAEEGYYNSDVCNGATLMERATNRVPFIMGSPEGSICVTLTEVPGFASHPTYPLCVRHECDIQSRVLILQFKPEQPNGICYVNCSADQSRKIISITRDPACTGRSGRTSLVCPDYETVCEKKTSTTATTTTSKATIKSTTGVASVEGSSKSSNTITSTSVEMTAPKETTTSKGSGVAKNELEPGLHVFPLIICLNLAAKLELK